MNAHPTYGLFVGRFQPFHRGHLDVLRALRRQRPNEPILVGIGSAQESFTWENPFTAGERFEMIAHALSEAHLDGVAPVPIADIHRHALWVAYLESILPRFGPVYTNNPLTRSLFEDSGHRVESPPLVDRERLVGRGIRAALARGESVADRVPPAVGEWLEAHRASARLRMLRSTEVEEDPETPDGR
ncbi:MAG: nicotinamide-nucleotide adenylyltransferase [Thermoplasmata archaeon]